MNILSKKTITTFFLFILAIVNIWLAFTTSVPTFASSFNILFHEAGHMIFFPFGNFIHALGGTLGELIIPILFIGYFLKQKDIAGEVFSYWWLGVACYDVSLYVADARARVLHLIGGQGGHDWAYILGRLGWLKYDIFISKIFILTLLIIAVYMIKRILDYKNIILIKPH